MNTEPTVAHRYYQMEAIEAICRDIEAGENPLCIMATGTGKTIVFSSVIGLRNDRSLVLAHRDELLDQAISKINWVCDRPMIGKEKAGVHATPLDMIVVASVQTLQNARLKKWTKNHFGLIVTDEAHHAPAKSYRNIYNHFEGYSHLGVTATPDRADSKQLGKIFTKISYQYPLHKAIKDGFLVPIKGRKVDGFDIDLSELKIVAGDFTDDDLGKVMIEKLIPIARSICDETSDKRTLVFMPNVESSRMMAQALRDLDIDAAYLSGAHTPEERRDILYRYSTGQISHLVSCNILLEGYDEPQTEAIVMLRPTTSRALYAQAVGRGTRLSPGKECLYLVEFTFNSDRLKLVTPYELFSAAGFGEQVQQEARRKEKGEVDYLEALERASEEHYSVKGILDRLPVKKYGFTSFDPIAFGELLGVDVTGEFDITYQGRKLTGAITPKQRELLSRYRIANLDSLDKAQASTLIDAIFKKNFLPLKGEATSKQMALLSRLGVNATGLSAAQASMLITQLKELRK